METEIVRTTAALRERVAQWRAEGLTHAVVPTMGALHEGHLSLVRLGLEMADRVVVTLFVNPKQFDSSSDLTRYPRSEQADLDAVQGAGAQLLFAPDAAEIYPPRFSSAVSMAGVAEPLEGRHRPGHFDGVATVVTKLLNMSEAPIAIFGEKDYQQLTVIRQLVDDLNMAVRIVGAPTVRESDGLALSSRNRLLSVEQRQVAAALYRSLDAARAALVGGGTVRDTLAEAKGALGAAGFTEIDYVALADGDTLTPMNELDRPARLLAAASIGEIRLIDNLAVEPRSDGMARSEARRLSSRPKLPG